MTVALLLDLSCHPPFYHPFGTFSTGCERFWHTSSEEHRLTRPDDEILRGLLLPGKLVTLFFYTVSTNTFLVLTGSLSMQRGDAYSPSPTSSSDRFFLYIVFTKSGS